MAETDWRTAEELLRKRGLAAKGLVDKPESTESDPIAQDEGAAHAASALRRSG